MSREIIITIKADGSTEVEAFGFTGRECIDATAAFERILGEVKGRRAKPEMYVREKAGVKQNVRGE